MIGIEDVLVLRRACCRYVAFLLLLCGQVWGAAPFFDPTVPLHGTPVNVGKNGVIARGLLLRVGENEWVVYDQDLLRPALWFESPEGKPPVSLEMMAQASWSEPTKRGGLYSPKPNRKEGKGLDLTPALPGVGLLPEHVLKDPRPVYGTDPGRGGLEESERRFLGYHFSGYTAVLSYECGDIQVKEWFEGRRGGIVRHLSVGPGAELLFLIGSGDFTVKDGREAMSAGLQVSANHGGVKFEMMDGKLLARVAASKHERRVSISYGSEMVSTPSQTPVVPQIYPAKWPRKIETRLRSTVEKGPGWELDRLALPGENPWKRRVRPADITFLSPDRAAVVTFEGDVWKVDFLNDKAQWTRIAGGLCEPLAIEHVGGVVQVFTRHGICRLRDLNGDGETDFYENHSSLLHQTVGTRGYPLDMEVDESGRTWISVGGIATDSRSITNKAPANPHSGAILEISADGRKLEVVARRAREPFFGRDPETGRIVMSEQQGNWVPSSGSFPVMPGANFGYGGGDIKPAEPAVWIPHDQDNSSSSPFWVRGTKFKDWDGGVMQLSYGTGRLFLVRHGKGWPAVEGTVIPLGIPTDIPILHARAHPEDGSIWFAGFRIYDSRVADLQGIARLRATGEPLAEPVNATVVKEGVILNFTGELQAVSPDMVQAKEWQYKRSPGYGSPRIKRDGSQGVEAVPTGGVFLSKDKKSVFVHIPDLKPTMQLELMHRFRVRGTEGEMRPVYFTVTAPPPADWAAMGFDSPVLDASLVAVNRPQSNDQKPSAKLGREIAMRYGCVACHSLDGALDGHSGPSWKGLYGSERRFTDGTQRIADQEYLLESILEPAKTIVEGYALGMGSYAGVLSDTELKSVLLFIEELK